MLIDGTEYSDSEEDEFESSITSSSENSDSDDMLSTIVKSSNAIDWISSTSNLLKPKNIKRFGNNNLYLYLYK